VPFIPLRKFPWIPDGQERNDYEHTEFVPFNYDKHGLTWDPAKWPIIETGKE